MKFHRPASLFVLLAALSVSLTGQSVTGPIVMGAGYEYPAPLYLAPGQLVTLFVQGIPLGTAFTRAPGGSDLPDSLAGISAGMLDRTGQRFVPLSLSILEVRPFRTCLFPTNYACFTPAGGVTVQVPFEVTLGSGDTGSGTLGVSVDGGSGFSVDVYMLSDRVHILKAADAVLPITATGAYNGHCYFYSGIAAPRNLTGLPCPPMVAHADGSLVSAKSPAKPGEELVAYAVGLGQTSPPLKTGQLVTSPARTVTTYTLDFNYRPNALATRPPPIVADGDAGAVPQPLYAGATPGFVGLYQINFVVPPVPPGTPPCAQIADTQVPTANLVYSNLTVSLGGRYSFDGAGICVAVDAPPPSAASSEPESERK